MNLYEHTIIARQDISPTQLKQIQDKYSKIVEKHNRCCKIRELGINEFIYLIKKIKKVTTFISK